MQQMMFAVTYPAYHPKKGKPTFFSTGICKAIYGEDFDKELIEAPTKWHTIRKGFRWKVGDKFLPKIWTGKPYRSKPLPFLNPLTVKKVFKFRLTAKGDYLVNGKKITYDKLKKIALNDGFVDVDDFELWFSKEKTFYGQIICWSDNINY